MSDSLPNIYYSSESNKFINLANIKEKQDLSSMKETQNSIEAYNKDICESIDFNQQTQQKEKQNPVIDLNESIPSELSGTILSITDFNLSDTNIIIGGITIYVKDDKGNKFEIHANPTDLIINITERYRHVAKINNDYRIFLMKETGEGLHRNMSLEAQEVGDKDTIIAKQLDDEMRKKLKENIKKGLTFFIIDSEFGNEAFYGKGNVMFKIFADKFRGKHPGKKFSFRYSGMVIKDETKTIEELGFEQSERVFANVIDENEND